MKITSNVFLMNWKGLLWILYKWQIVSLGFLEKIRYAKNPLNDTSLYLLNFFIKEVEKQSRFVWKQTHSKTTDNKNKSSKSTLSGPVFTR